MARHSFPDCKVGDLAQVLVGARLIGDEGTVISGITQDSRDVRPGDLYCCVPGEIHDGHSFASAAVAAGASCLLVDREVKDVDVPLVVVPHVRSALGPAAVHVFGHPSRDMLSAGVTGTNGKTSVVTMLGAIMEAAGHRTTVLGTLHGERTTPEAIDLHARLRDDKHSGMTAVAMEVSSHALAQHRTDGLVFDVAVLTHVGRDHLDFHGSHEAYVEAKMRLFRPEMCRRAVVNVDDPVGARLASESPVSVEGFSLSDATEVDVRVHGVSFRWRGSSISVPVGGSFSVANALAAATAAESLGFSRDAVIEGLASLPPIRGRFETVGNTLDVDVIVDYAHTPEGLETLLATARTVARGRLLLVFGCGGDRDQGKRALMGEVAARLADDVTITSDNPRSEDPDRIIAEVAEGAVPPTGSTVTVRTCTDRAEAIASALRAARRGDMVVIAGKGHETHQEIGGRRLPFDDAEVARRVLSQIMKDEHR